MAAITLRKDADILQYCDTVYKELSEMKKKVLDIICGVETTTIEEEARKAEYFDLFDLVDHIEKKLESLRKKCPRDWKGTREEIESGKRKLAEAINWWFG
jgi:hypothetical protein